MCCYDPSRALRHSPEWFRWEVDHDKVRDVSFVALAALSAMLGLAANVDAEDASPTIVTLGDSYINSYGVAPADAFAATLKSALNAAWQPSDNCRGGVQKRQRTGSRLAGGIQGWP